MDYAFAPGPTKYDLALNRMLQHRVATTMVKPRGPATIKNFVQYLNTKAAPLPFGDMLIGSHGNDNAYMQVRLNEAFGAMTKYEDLVKEIASTTRKCQLADNVVNPRPVIINNNPMLASVFIKGCRVGLSVPFLTKLKEVFNGLSTTEIKVAAPRFFHSIHPEAQGEFEFFLYNFEHIVKDPVTDRATLIAIMDAKSLDDIHGTKIPADSWGKWIPKRRIHFVEVTGIQRVVLNPKPIPRLSDIPAGRYRHEQPAILTYDFSVTGTIPSDKDDQMQLLRARLHSVAANPGTDSFEQTIADDHPYPFYKRFGYTDLDDMINNLSWNFGARKGNKLLCIGSRHEYSINPAIVGPAINELIFNYYAANARTTSHRMFRDNDIRFFQNV